MEGHLSQLNANTAGGFVNGANTRQNVPFLIPPFNHSLQSAIDIAHMTAAGQSIYQPGWSAWPTYFPDTRLPQAGIVQQTLRDGLYGHEANAIQSTLGVHRNTPGSYGTVLLPLPVTTTSQDGIPGWLDRMLGQDLALQRAGSVFQKEPEQPAASRTDGGYNPRQATGSLANINQTILDDLSRDRSNALGLKRQMEEQDTFIQTETAKRRHLEVQLASCQNQVKSLREGGVRLRMKVQEMLVAQKAERDKEQRRLTTLASEVVKARKEVKEAKREAEEAKDRLLCTVCQETEAVILLMKCGHLCLCAGCTNSIMLSPHAECPICRQHIDTTIRTFRS